MLNENLSEFIGALIGDGCLSKYWSNYDNRWKYVVAFTGFWDTDHRYYEDVIRPIATKEFGLKGYLYHRKDDDTVRFFISSRKVFLTLKSFGIPVGEKNQISISKELKSENFAKAFIRGVFNTDGSVYRRYGRKYIGHSRHYKNYAVVQFKMKNRNVVEFVKKSLDGIGIKTTKVGRVADKYWVTRITTQASVERFFKDLEINHINHLNRYREIVSS
ncbi:MAG: LAGLIDADG family homing endonuclease [Candidatus Aenigmatarchaeota archaeon]